jgi:hypothetical protein
LDQGRTDWKAPHEELGGQSLEDWLRENYAEQSLHDLRAAMQEMGVEISHTALRRKTENMGLRRGVGEGTHIAPRFEARAPRAEAVDWRATIDAAIALQDQREATSFVENSPLIEIETDVPVAVTWTADWHLGGGTTDHRAWRDDLEYFLRAPGLYVAVVGDEVENMRSFNNLAAVVSQVLPPDLQRGVLQGVTKELVASGKLLFTVWGNHGEEFEERLLGESLLNQVRRTQGVPHLGGLGLVRLRVGETTYTVLATHKAKYRSSFNALHAAKRMYQMMFPADVIVTAHDHQPGYEQYEHYGLAREMGFGLGGTSHLIACCCYKTLATNDWAARRYGKAVLKRETTVFWPDRHHMETYDDARSAVERIQATE